jgi:hypothetical protein
MLQRTFLAAIFALISCTSASFALTPKQKMETCRFGADDQKLKGAPRQTFLSRCMTNEPKSAKQSKPKPQPKS